MGKEIFYRLLFLVHFPGEVDDDLCQLGIADEEGAVEVGAEGVLVEAAFCLVLAVIAEAVFDLAQSLDARTQIGAAGVIFIALEGQVKALVIDLDVSNQTVGFGFGIVVNRS